jgi:nitrate/nitrite transport system ATP-binding protein
VEALWTLTQMARWGIVPFPRNWIEVLARTRRIDVFGQAAREVGLLDIGRDRNPLHLFDESTFDPDNPIDYLKSFAIKRDVQIEEIALDQLTSVS